MDIFRNKDSVLYSSLGGESEKDDESSSSLLNSETSSQQPPRNQRIWPFVLPWIVSTFALAWVSAYLYLNSLPPAQLEAHSYSTGWKTDFGKLFSYFFMLNGYLNDANKKAKQKQPRHDPRFL
jgi:hypothetical protein